MTTIINLYGGPGCGKSTSAAYLFYLLKSMGKEAELVREYVKDWAWEGRKFSAYDQLYFLGKQIRRESMLYGKVDYIVTDAPVLLNSYYSKEYAFGPLATGAVATVNGFYKQAEKDGHRHVHVLLHRSKPYDPAGRYHTLEQALKVDRELIGHLIDFGVSFIRTSTDKSNLDTLLTGLI